MISYKRAWNCKKCPENNGEYGCPCWAEVTEEQITTGEVRIVKGCLFQYLPHWLTLVIQASNRPAAAFESARNEIVRAIGQAIEVKTRLLDR